MCVALRALRTDDPDELREHHIAGENGAHDKIAVIRIEGVLMEGSTRFYIKQIEQAAKDDRVKAIVLRIESPGGTITASEEIHRLLTQLRDGKLRKFPDGKPRKLIVSMGAIAASGGYYIAMPAEKIFAEKTCITGSIGVYASLPNVAELINRNGIKFELIKAGGIKASGSPFHELTPQERQPWQEMVDAAYDGFLDTVVAGRPQLTKPMLRDGAIVRDRIAIRDDKGNLVKDWWGQTRKVEYVRYRADGGTFTAPEAKKYGLIDDIGDLDDAIDAAAVSAKLTWFQAVHYEKPATFLNSLIGIQANPAAHSLDPKRLSHGLSPRLWFLSSQADLSGILSAMGSERP